MEHLLSFWNIITHLNVHLAEWARWMGPWLYVALFVVVFCETGLVVTPFLPGDSLLFAIGALCAVEGSPITLVAIVPLLIVAAILGDATNYFIGARLGPKVFRSEGSLLFNKKHLVRTQEFYEKYGGKTIIIARFVPIIRTFAPFVAGIGQMRYSRFAAFNVIGGVAWVAIFAPLGFWFGNQPYIQKNFHYVIFAIIILSVMPAVIEILREWRKKKTAEVAVTPSQS
ncbi:MAG TPA: DedA family protein [Polyangiaceae bacterium]|nr:DedA family protein [Polyangiaceae bacterium]